jgi:predicted PurR-regulated permease PerM
MSYFALALLCIVILGLGFIINELYDMVHDSINDLKTMHLNMQSDLQRLAEYINKLQTRCYKKHKNNNETK